MIVDVISVIRMSIQFFIKLVDIGSKFKWGWVSLVARASDSQSEKAGLNAACTFKQGTLSYLLHLWRDM